MPRASAARTEALQVTHLLKQELERVHAQQEKSTSALLSRRRLERTAFDSAKELTRNAVSIVATLQDRVVFLEDQVRRYKDLERIHVVQQTEATEALRLKNQRLQDENALLRHRVEVLTSLGGMEDIFSFQRGARAGKSKSNPKGVRWRQEASTMPSSAGSVAGGHRFDPCEEVWADAPHSTPAHPNPRPGKEGLAVDSIVEPSGWPSVTIPGDNTPWAGEG
ncbi:unnamed protein product, partial [Discosporangium mesarthrocarpum]